MTDRTHERAKHLLYNLAPAAVILIACCLLLFGCWEDMPQKVRGQSSGEQKMSNSSEPVAGKRILLVHSYHAEYPWVDAITRGVKERLSGTGVELEVFYMDTKRKTDEHWKVRSAELASRKVEEYKPDIIITVDDNCQQYFAKKYVDGPIPLVFCGVNSDPSKYGYPASNVTGVIERAHFKDTLDYTGMFRPIEKVAVLSSDDPTSIGTLNFMKQEYVDFEVVEWNLISDFDEWKEAVKRYNETVDAFGIYMYHTIKEKGNPVSLEPKIVMEWTAQNATIPTMGFFDFGIEDGQMVGVVESGEEHGDKAARYALEILKGTPINLLPVIKAHIGMRMINRNTAERLGMPLNDEVTKDALIVPED